MSSDVKSRNSLFELLGKSREKVLANRPNIPPPGQLARPGVAVAPPPARKASSVATIERAVEEVLEIDGDPLIVVDDELEVGALTPEDGQADEPPAQIYGVRLDTAVVFGIGTVLVIAIAFLAGRTARSMGSSAAPEPPASVAKLEAPNVVAPAPIEAPRVEPAAKTPEPKVEKAPEAPPPKAPEVPAGSYEAWVVTTTVENADKVVKHLNESMLSPIAGKKGLQAYAKKTSRGAQVRVRGFEKPDPEVLEGIKGMADPTGGGGFSDADYHKISPRR